MTILSISGQRALRGSQVVRGDRLSALSAIAAAVITPEPVTLRNVPHVASIGTALEMLHDAGIGADWTASHEVTIHAQATTIRPLAYRDDDAFALIIAALIARYRKVSCALPEHLDVDTLVARPDVLALARCGIAMSVEEGQLILQAGANRQRAIAMTGFGSTGVLQAVLALSMSQTPVTISDAVVTPATYDVMAMLQHLGVLMAIEEGTILLQGSDGIRGRTFTLPPGRVEILLFATAAAVTDGDILLANVTSQDVAPLLSKLRQAGIASSATTAGVRFWRDETGLQPATIAVRPYPGFVEDWLPCLLPVLTQAQGESNLTFPVLEWLDELAAHLVVMGAEIKLDAGRLRVFGPTMLRGGPILALRRPVISGVLIAALAAKGASEVYGMDVLDDEFESMAERLHALGAAITRRDSTGEIS